MVSILVAAATLYVDKSVYGPPTLYTTPVEALVILYCTSEPYKSVTKCMRTLPVGASVP